MPKEVAEWSWASTDQSLNSKQRLNKKEQPPPLQQCQRGMERAAYLQLVAALQLPVSAVPHFALLAARHGVSPDTVYSIYHQ